MPKKFLELEETLKECAFPVMMFLSKGEVASQKTTLRAFSDGNGLNLVTNIDKIYNPVTGELLPYIEKSQQECSGDEFKQLDDLIAVKTDTDVVIGVDADLAFALGGESGYCPITGKETTFHYAEAAEDDSSNEEDESSSDEDTFEAVDDSLNSDEDYSEDEEDVIFNDDEADEEESTEEVMDENLDGSSAEEASEEVVEQPAVEEPVEAPVKESVEQASEEVEVVNDAVVQEIPAMAIADEDANLKLVTLTNDNSEVAAFVGDTHVGTLRRTRASEKAAPLFEDGSKLVAAFKPVFNMNRSNQSSSELAAYGYTPVTFKVKVGELFNKRLEKETASINNEAAEKVKSSINDMARLIELSFVGINKGLFECDNELANELASLLSRNGVKNAQREVRRALAKHSHGYIKAGVEKAKELSSKSEDYIQGIAETVSKSEFVGSIDEDRTETATYVPPVSTVETAEFIGKSDTKKPAVNKYSRLFR